MCEGTVPSSTAEVNDEIPRMGAKSMNYVGRSRNLFQDAT